MASFQTVPNKVAFGLTYVRYTEHDTWGQILAFFTLAPILIHTGLIGALIARREMCTAMLLVGLTLNEIISLVLKKLIQEPRPETCEFLEACESYGMPSSHAQYVIFLATNVTLAAIRHKYRKVQPPFLHTPFAINRFDNVQLLLLILVWPLAFMVIESRMYLGYHTADQVLKGSVAGLFFGSLWFNLEARLQTFYPALQATKFCRTFFLKDSSHIPNAFAYEYASCLKAQSQREAATKKVE